MTRWKKNEKNMKKGKLPVAGRLHTGTGNKRNTSSWCHVELPSCHRPILLNRKEYSLAVRNSSQQNEDVGTGNLKKLKMQIKFYALGSSWNIFTNSNHINPPENRGLLARTMLAAARMVAACSHKTCRTTQTQGFAIENCSFFKAKKHATPMHSKDAD